MSYVFFLVWASRNAATLDRTFFEHQINRHGPFLALPPETELELQLEPMAHLRLAHPANTIYAAAPYSEQNIHLQRQTDILTLDRTLG